MTTPIEFASQFVPISIADAEPEPVQDAAPAESAPIDATESPPPNAPAEPLQAKLPAPADAIDFIADRTFNQLAVARASEAGLRAMLELAPEIRVRERPGAVVELSVEGAAAEITLASREGDALAAALAEADAFMRAHSETFAEVSELDATLAFLNAATRFFGSEVSISRSATPSTPGREDMGIRWVGRDGALLITDVVPGSPAWEAGVRPGAHFEKLFDNDITHYADEP
ncbi:MAG: hypothetical protein AAF658_18570, partial [Myxococcota bacterium]